MSKYKKAISQNVEIGFVKLIKICLLALLISIGIGAIVTLLLSLIFFNLPDPTSKIKIVSLLSLYITIFISGFVLSKIIKQKYFISGLILGVMIFVINLAFSFILKVELNASDYIWKLLIPVVCILGSMVGIKKERKSYRNKRFLR
jgi:putative membrane protein (TIGR04086 family)